MQKRVNEAEENLKENIRFKSILYNNGDALVEVVFEILEKMLKCDLSGFVDKKKEDFLIENEDYVFIGEIKGITSNVKNEHITQLELHYQSYIDDLENERDEDLVHSLLIINPFRTKDPLEREPVNEKQINLAKRNKSLIIETTTLLHLFELFQKDKISSEKCVMIFASKIGLLVAEDFEGDFD